MSLAPRFAAYAIVAALLVLVPWLVESQYYLRVIVLCGFYIVLAVSLNITVGYTGLLTIGHAAFFGMGAYVTSLLMLDAGWNFWPALAIGGLVAGLFGLLLGFPSLRLRGDYLAIATIAFSETLRLIALNWNDVTRGPMGVPGIPRPVLGGLVISSQIHYYYLVLALVLLTTYSAIVIKSSIFGRALLAMRDNEIAAEAMGVNTRLYKVLAFMSGAFFAGLAGGVFAPWLSFISPDNFTYLDSVMFLCMVIIGGLGNVWGAIIGAVVITIGLEALRPLETFRMAIFGGILVVMMLFRPQGLVGSAAWSRSKVRLSLSRLWGRQSQATG